MEEELDQSSDVPAKIFRKLMIYIVMKYTLNVYMDIIKEECMWAFTNREEAEKYRSEIQTDFSNYHCDYKIYETILRETL